MKENELQDLKKRYDQLKNTKQKITILEKQRVELLNKKKQLEDNDIVMEYLNSIRKIEKIDKLIDTMNCEWTDTKFIEEFAYPVSTNGIYVCMGGYAKTDRIYMSGGNMYFEPSPNKTKILSIDDENVTYRIYWNVENNENKIIEKKVWEDFEENHLILFPHFNEAIAFYNQAKLLFYKTCFENSQEEAIQKVMEMKENKFQPK